MNRGGKRAGSGRKATEGARRTITLRLPLDAYAILDEMTNERHETKTQILTRLLRERKK